MAGRLTGNLFYWSTTNADSRTAFISIRSHRHTDSGKLFFICGRLRGAGIAASCFLFVEDYGERGAAQENKNIVESVI